MECVNKRTFCALSKIFLRNFIKGNKEKKIALSRTAKIKLNFFFFAILEWDQKTFSTKKKKNKLKMTIKKKVNRFDTFFSLLINDFLPATLYSLLLFSRRAIYRQSCGFVECATPYTHWSEWSNSTKYRKIARATAMKDDDFSRVLCKLLNCSAREREKEMFITDIKINKWNGTTTKEKTIRICAKAIS